MIPPLHALDESASRGLPKTVSLRDHHARMEIMATLQHLVKSGTLHSSRVWILFSAVGLFCCMRHDVSRRRAAVQTQQRPPQRQHPIKQTAQENHRQRLRASNRSHLPSLGKETARASVGLISPCRRLWSRILNVQVCIISLWFEIIDGDTLCSWLNNFT